MQIDLVLACLLIVLGAIIAYTIDELYQLTPRMSVWLGRLLGD